MTETICLKRCRSPQQHITVINSYLSILIQIIIWAGTNIKGLCTSSKQEMTTRCQTGYVSPNTPSQGFPRPGASQTEGPLPPHEKGHTHTHPHPHCSSLNLTSRQHRWESLPRTEMNWRLVTPNCPSAAAMQAQHPHVSRGSCHSSRKRHGSVSISWRKNSGVVRETWKQARPQPTREEEEVAGQAQDGEGLELRRKSTCAAGLEAAGHKAQESVSNQDTN